MPTPNGHPMVLPRSRASCRKLVNGGGRTAQFKLSAIICVALLVGCSSSDKVSPELEPPQELTLGSKAAVETPEAELLREAQRYFDSGVYSVAKDVFERLRDGYPLGAYAEFAAIKVADCEFESSNFPIAAALYEEFLKNRPASRSTPYVLLRAARSNQLANQGIGRDDTSLRRARDLYLELLDKYPNSPFAEGARTLLQQAELTLSENYVLIIEFYRKQGKDPAVLAREEKFREHFGAEAILRETGEPPSAPREMVAEAPVGTPVLIEQSVLAAIPESGEDGSDNSSDRMARAFGTNDSDASIHSIAGAHAARRARASLPVVRLVECDRARGFIFLHLSTDIPYPGSVEALGPLVASDGVFSLRIEGVSTPGKDQLERDCFGSGDVTISPDGNVAIHSSRPTGATAQVLELTSPSRILVAIDG